MIAAAFAIFQGSAIARYIAAGLAALAIMATVYQTGVNAERKRGQAASLRIVVAAQEARIAEMQRQVAASKQVIDQFETTKSKDDLSIASLEKKVDEYAKSQSKGKVVGPCGITRDDQRGMRG